MRHSLALSFALLTFPLGFAAAQSCRGFAPSSTGTLQVSGNASLTPESSTIAADVGYRFVRGLFADASIGNTSSTTFDGSTLELGGSVGYEVTFGQVSMCPLASGGMGMGPNRPAGAGENRSSRSALLGFSVGTLVQGPRNSQLAPTVMLGYAYRMDQAENNQGTSLFRIADHYTQAQLGLGVIVRNFTIRPYADLPLSFGDGDPSVGVSVSVQFGREARPGLERVP